MNRLVFTPDGEDQHRDRRDRVERLPRERAHGVAHVLDEALEPCGDPHASRLLPRQGDVAERAARLDPGLAGRHPGPLERLALQLLVEPQLLAKVLVEAPMPQPGPKPIQEPHHARPALSHR